MAKKVLTWSDSLYSFSRLVFINSFCIRVRISLQVSKMWHCPMKCNENVILINMNDFYVKNSCSL